MKTKPETLPGQYNLWQNLLFYITYNIYIYVKTNLKLEVYKWLEKNSTLKNYLSNT